MSNIPFLNIARQGKNNWWMYLITSVLSLVVASFLAGFLIIILLAVYHFYGIFEGNFISEIMADVNDPLFLLLLLGISYTFSFILFYLCFLLLHKRSLLSVITAYQRFNLKRVMKGAVLWLFILVVFSIPSMILYPGDYIMTFHPEKFVFLLLLSVVVFPIQASFEEIFFRGYLMQGVGLISKRPIIPLMITSIIFGAFHFFNSADLNLSVFLVIYTFVLGLMLGIIVLGENGIETAMGVHIVNNLYVALIFNSTDSGLGNLPSLITVQETEPVSGLITIIAAAVILITILFWNKKENLIPIFRS